MSDKSKQQISNLMDGELEINASKFLLKRMAADDSLSETWNNYHLIKSCLQKEKDEPLFFDIASEVGNILRREQRTTGHDTAQVKERRWMKSFKPVLGMGIAASVAFLSVMMIQNRTINNGINELEVNGNNIIVVNDKNSEGLTAPDTNISANLAAASGGQILVPPPSLSRFPSVSATRSNNVYAHNFSQPAVVSYIFYVDENEQGKDNNQQTPMTVKDISE
ncbi:MAG: sigma-E factor negative regulatory protein [Gammaproteobacteria bacterium]|jgi:negative regulator of sigma E activity|nr:sigma-E factor negative regulatory protein [Xanthomonadales bacterium]